MSSAVPALDFGSMTQVIQFLMEIDKLKGVQRRTKVLGTQRQENSAEHSWHFAIAAMSLAPYAGDDVDIQRVIQMALLHDIVEIDAGDVLVYDLAARAAIHDQEVAAARRLFGMLPEAQREYFTALWQEYEDGESADARFALLLDRTCTMKARAGWKTASAWSRCWRAMHRSPTYTPSCGTIWSNTCGMRSAKAG